MMAVPIRVALLTGGRIRIRLVGSVFPERPDLEFPQPGTRWDCERQIDDALRALASELRNIEVEFWAETDAGHQLAAEFPIRDARFHSVRRSLVEALTRRAHQADTLGRGMAALADATLLDGRIRDAAELPERLHPPRMNQLPPGLYGIQPRSGVHRVGHCNSCHKRFPTLLGYENGLVVTVLQLHRAVPRRSVERPPPIAARPICRLTMREWSFLDPRPLQGVDEPRPPAAPAMMNRRVWIDHYLSIVPAEFGGPMLDQRSVFEAIWRARAGGAS